MDVINATPPSSEALRKAVWIQRLVSSFLLVETLAIAGAGCFLSGRMPPQGQALPLLIGLSLLCLTVPFLVPPLIHQLLTKTWQQQQPRTPEAVLKICQGMAIVMMALRMTPGVISLPLMLLSGEPLWGLPATALAIITLLQNWPNQEWFTSFINEQLRRLT